MVRERGVYEDTGETAVDYDARIVDLGRCNSAASAKEGPSKAQPLDRTLVGGPLPGFLSTARRALAAAPRHANIDYPLFAPPPPTHRPTHTNRTASLA